MSYNLLLPRNLVQAGWKVKIHDRERLEPPHVTIYRKMDKWRLSLRNRDFLDTGHKWNQIDDEVREVIENKDNWNCLIAEWDAMYPANPVQGEYDE